MTQIIPKARSLFGFINSSVVTRGEVTLPIFAKKMVRDTTFHVVTADMVYNIILERSWIHDMDAVPSTLHQVLKFQSKWRIWHIKGDQQAAGEINFMTYCQWVT